MRTLRMAHDTGRVEIASGKSIKSGVREPLKHGRASHIVPDGPDCQWKGGAFERIEAQNRRWLEEHLNRLNAGATDRCTVCGVNHDLVDHAPDRTRPERTITLCRGCRDKRIVAPAIGPRARELIASIPDDLSIPAFLKRA
jgi:hypothetical protein